MFDGNFAVWLFWVMSAMVLSLRYHSTTDKLSQRDIVIDSAIRRYPRLFLPVLASILFAWGLHQCGFMSNIKLAELLGDQYDRWLGSQYLFAPDFFSAISSAAWQTFFAFDKDATYNGVLWTMEVELFGSLFLFGFLFLFGSTRFRIYLYAVSIILFYLLSLHWLNAFVFGIMLSDIHACRDSFLQRAPKMVLPAFDYLTSSSWVAGIFSGCALYLIGLPNLHQVLHLILATIVTAYVVKSDPAKWFFSQKPLVFLGKISFGLYLVHTPIICAAAYPLYVSILSFASPLIAAWIASLLIAFASIGGGWLLWLVADQPAIRFSRWFSAKIRQAIARCGS